MSLIERIREARKTRVAVGDFTFTVMRPTDMDVVGLRGSDGGISNGVLLERFVIGWEGVRECDVVPGGSPTPASFSRELFVEWVADRPGLWEPLVRAITEGYLAHQAELEAAAKNSPPG